MLAHSFWSYKRGNLFGRKGWWDYGCFLELHYRYIWGDTGVRPYGGAFTGCRPAGAQQRAGRGKRRPYGWGAGDGAEGVHHPSLKAGA
jgi:hypothetical protein